MEVSLPVVEPEVFDPVVWEVPLPVVVADVWV